MCETSDGTFEKNCVRHLSKPYLITLHNYITLKNNTHTEKLDEK